MGPIIRNVYRKWINPLKPFSTSANYWEERYKSGGNSGDGSYGKLAEFKAGVLNRFVKEQNVKTIIEYGCGDGNQLRLADYPLYIGFDVSPKAITLCRKIFSSDTTKTFRLMNEYNGEKAQLTLSLDVIYHLVEDDVYHEYMFRLFDSAERFVVIYSSNIEESLAAYLRQRKFTEWVDKMKPEWKLRSHIPNMYAYTGDSKTSSFSDFYIFERA